MKSNTTPIPVYDSFAAYQNQKQADIVWFDQKIPYDLAFWIHTDSLEPKYEKGAVVLIKQTYYDQAGAIYAIDFDGQTLINEHFVGVTVFDWFPLIRNIVIKSFH